MVRPWPDRPYRRLRPCLLYAGIIIRQYTQFDSVSLWHCNKMTISIATASTAQPITPKIQLYVNLDATLQPITRVTRKPCCRRETARYRCKFWSIPSLLALCWSNISQSNAVSQWMHRVCVNMSEEAKELLTRLSLLGRLFMCPTCALRRWNFWLRTNLHYNGNA